MQMDELKCRKRVLRRYEEDDRCVCKCSCGFEIIIDYCYMYSLLIAADG